MESKFTVSDICDGCGQFVGAIRVTIETEKLGDLTSTTSQIHRLATSLLMRCEECSEAMAYVVDEVYDTYDDVDDMHLRPQGNASAGDFLSPRY